MLKNESSLQSHRGWLIKTWELQTPEQLTVLSFLMDLILESEDMSDHYNQLNEDKHTVSKEIDEMRKKKQKAQNVVTLSQYAKKLRKMERRKMHLRMVKKEMQRKKINLVMMMKIRMGVRKTIFSLQSQSVKGREKKIQRKIEKGKNKNWKKLNN